MSQDLNNEFRKDPFAFAQKYALMPGGAEGLLIETLPQAGQSTGRYSAKSTAVDGYYLYKVRGEARILGGDLSLKNENDPYCKVVIVDKKVPPLEAPCFPMYYLHWGKDSIIRTTCRPTKPQLQRGLKTPISAIEAAHNAAANPPYIAEDPDIFVTANVNGCMVVVEGSRQEPTVYHCNAISTAYKGEQSPLIAATKTRDADLARGVMQAKVDAMATRYKQMIAADPKGLRAPTNLPEQTKAITQKDYMLLAQSNIIGAGSEQDAGNIRTQIAAQVNQAGNLDQKIRIIRSMGTVFGCKKTGLWTFYYQRLINYELWHDVAPWYWRSSDWKKLSRDHWHIAECKEFWPHGEGVAIL
jgi:hypothetical protein